MKQRYLKLNLYANQAKLIARRLLLYPAAWIRRRLTSGVVVIGITGSAGKTTTKDICSTLLAQFGPCVSTTRSQNYRISAAETLLKLKKKHKYAILEISGGRPGIMDLPIRLAKPKIGVLTIIGRDHYSQFKSKESIAAEKGKLISRLPRDGVAVLNIDDPLIRAIGNACHARCIWFGRAEGATLRLLEVSSRWPEPLTLTLEYESKVYRVITGLFGEYFALSILASLGVALATGIPIERAIAAVAASRPSEGRMQPVIEKSSGITFMRDDWKSPHWSIEAPFRFMKDAKAERKIAVIGNISDSSHSPAKRYKSVANQVRQFADLVVFVGLSAEKALAARTSPGDKSIQAFPRLMEASQFLDSYLKSGDLVLLKGNNKSDHLVRLIHNRQSPINCWAVDCEKKEFCDYCEELYRKPQAAGLGETIAKHPAPAVNEGKLWETVPGGSVLIVGLGNPGGEYKHTAHNLGYEAVERLAKSLSGHWNSDGSILVFRSLLADGQSVTLAKPDVPINHSGRALLEFFDRCPGETSHIIILHDDFDIAAGSVKFKRQGGHAGHKGVLSVIQALGTERFDRVRIGVRPEGNQRRGLELALASITSLGEQGKFDSAMEKACEIVMARCREINSKPGVDSN